MRHYPTTTTSTTRNTVLMATGTWHIHYVATKFLRQDGIHFWGAVVKTGALYIVSVPNGLAKQMDAEMVSTAKNLRRFWQ
jgi:hypothetical protein